MIQWNSRLVNLIKEEFGGDASLFSESPFFRTSKARKFGIEFKYEKFEKEIKDVFERAGTTKDVLDMTGSVETPLVLKPFQEDILNKLDTNRFNLLGMCRQSGATTMFSLHALKEFMLGKNVLFLSAGGGMSEYTIDTVKKFYLKLPFYMQPGVHAWNSRSIYGKGGITSKDGTNIYKDDSFSFKHFDTIIIEGASFIKNFRLVYERIFTEVSKGQDMKLIIHSTTTDADGLLYELSKDSALKKNNFVFTAIDWRAAGFPEKDIELFRRDKSFEEEFELAGFLKVSEKGIDAVDFLTKEFNAGLKSQEDIISLETKLKECIKYIEYIAKELNRLKG